MLVCAVEDVARLLAQGQARRRVGQTAMNCESSRSHSVFCATLETASTDATGCTSIRRARLNLVDLAGVFNPPIDAGCVASALLWQQLALQSALQNHPSTEPDMTRSVIRAHP